MNNIFHYEYLAKAPDWTKYGLAYEGTSSYVSMYLRKLSRREDDEDFNDRKKSAYVPRYAAAAIDEVKDSILQRLIDIVREGGPDTYARAARGLDRGVDYQYSDMTTFMGDACLLDLLIYGKVGILVDNVRNPGATALDQVNHPYVKKYAPLDIRAWSMTDPALGFDAVLLSEQEDEYELGLVTGYTTNLRHYQRTEDGVQVTVYVWEDKTYVEADKIFLNIPRIPFTTITLKRPLMQDICDIQTELMNIESSDISYVLKSNLPFYVQTYSSQDNPYAKGNVPSVDEDGSILSGPKEARIGSSQGVQIPEGVRLPAFIAPPPDNLEVSMKKGHQLREMIRSIRNLNLQALTVQRESAESKRTDKDNMEAALSVIAKKLENAESEIAEHWAEFDTSAPPAKVTYPRKFSLLTEKERLQDASSLLEVADKVPSLTFKRAIFKKIVHVLLDVEAEDLNTILNEINLNPSLTSAEDLLQFAEQGILRKATVNEIVGIKDPEEEASTATEERIQFVQTTIEAQGLAARGLTETGDNASKQEKDAAKTSKPV